MKRPIVATLLLAGSLALATGCGAAASPPTPAAQPTATVDAATLAYIGVLRAYYIPYANAEHQAYLNCVYHFLVSTLPQQQQMLSTCRPLETAALTAAQALLAHLATTLPPPRWQASDQTVKGVFQAIVAYHTARLHAIDANSVAQYNAVNAGSIDQEASMLCGPIQQFNAGPPPLSPPLAGTDQANC